MYGVSVECEKNKKNEEKERTILEKKAKGVMKRCRTRHKHTGTLDKFNTHTLGVISLTLVPANEFRV